jgi:hypothetical protein
MFGPFRFAAAGGGSSFLAAGFFFFFLDLLWISWEAGKESTLRRFPQHHRRLRLLQQHRQPQGRALVQPQPELQTQREFPQLWLSFSQPCTLE